ncbi:WD40-repeat-containing domain protein [Coprinopsis sp. MPI-PUGE-AT-0042]|nr:WD40-repeat-containing domain protein [Coprinopsis sp. MPI-PUGE-AT-0042]
MTIPLLGGDLHADLRVKLWDFHQDDVTQPTVDFVGARANIFSLAFSAQDKWLYAGGACEALFRYDMSTVAEDVISRSPQATYIDSDGHIRSISCHPLNEDLALTASEDGCVRRYDGREFNGLCGPGSTLELHSEATGALYHPTIPHLFLTSTSQGAVHLRDERMAFGSGRRGQGIVQTYSTRLTKRSRSYQVSAEASSIAFDQDGSKFAVTFVGFFPTIYSTSDPHPIAICSGKITPEGHPIDPLERSYINSSTMKHGSFGALGQSSDTFYGAGSDDFRAYLWKIPSIAKLVEWRNEISAVDWAASSRESETIGKSPTNGNLAFTEPNQIPFTEGFAKSKIIPLDISQPFCRLTGHRSIVNMVVIHPQFLHVATCGIEKDVLLHSPTSGSPCTQDLERSPTSVRSLPVEGEEDRAAYVRALMGIESEENEEATIRMFDHILREDIHRNGIFETRRKYTGDSSEYDSEDTDEEKSEDDSDEASDEEEDTVVY